MSISLPSTEAGPSQIRKPSQQARDPGQKGTPARVKPLPVPVEAFDDPHAKEEETVHEVYESIAPHFAQTRHKPWPLITQFLTSLPPHSIGLDSGAGNGKYLPTAHAAGHVMIALDRSRGLLEISKEQVWRNDSAPSSGGDPKQTIPANTGAHLKGSARSIRGGGAECVRGDLGARCWREGVFDFAISVAAIHHLSTPLRRRQAVQALLPYLKHATQPPYSRFLIYVWAYEQGDRSKRAMGSAAGSRRSTPSNGIDEGGKATDKQDRESSGAQAASLDRLDTDGVSNRRDQHAGQAEKVQDVLVPWVLSKPKNKVKTKADPKTEGAETVAEEEPEKVYHRYYHLFVEGELEDLVKQAAIAEGYELRGDSRTNETVVEGQVIGGAEVENQRGPGKKWLRVRGIGWEADNWWLEGEVGIST